MKAKKSLGQHFLRSEKALRTIVDASDPNPLDLVIEIGPGHGELTDKLIPFVGKIILIEKDRELIPFLKEKYKDEIVSGKMDLLEKDILDFDLEILSFYKDHSYKVIANIPYYITGLIIKKFLGAKYKPSLMTLLVQKEVAQRIVAKDGKESILSISVKVFGKPKIVETVKKGSFSPPPKVDSAIITIEDIGRANLENISEKDFFEVLKTGFLQKRKQLFGNLKNVFGEVAVSKAFETCRLEKKIRSENLKLNDWICLTKNLKN